MRAGGADQVDQSLGRPSLAFSQANAPNKVCSFGARQTPSRCAGFVGDATLPVRSAQVSQVIWLILGVGVGLLFLAIAVRLVRRIRSERG